MKRIIFALCLLIAVTSCVSKKKYMVAENGRLAALSRERVLNRNLGQQKDEIAKLKQQITDLMSDTTRLGQAIRDYRKSLYSNLSEQEKLNMLLKEKWRNWPNGKLPSINYRPKSMRKTHVFKVY